ncbi:MAG: hypothetical protein JNJ41_05885 [Bacteroidia bacterium]|nr:hypothetical protein [Bacteroidia bacterium]
MDLKENNKKEKPEKIFVEKDILGLEKQTSNISKPKTNPNRIFMGLAIVIVIAILYWIFKK